MSRVVPQAVRQLGRRTVDKHDRTCRSARVVPSAAAGFCDQSSSANAAVAGPSLRARVSASCWRS